VLGQAQTPRRRLLPFAAIALAVLAAPALGLAGSTQHAQNLQHENAQIAAKSRAAVLDLYSLDQRLGSARSHLATLRAQSAALRAERDSVAQQLRVARRGSRIAQASLAQRLRLLYEQGNVEPLDVVFGAKSLDEALTSLDNLSRVTSQGEDVLRQLKTARGELRAALAKLAARESALAAATAQARSTALALSRTHAARSAYIGSLATRRRLNDAEIGTLLAQARAAELRSAKLVRLPAADATVVPPTAGSATGGSTVTVAATGYSLAGSTATGLPAGWGVVAVDPSVIPLGTHMTIPGYGEAVAADTGGAVVGTTIDLWFPTTAQANAWGRRTVTIVLH
jgi:cystine transport system substrate-binding protein